MRTCKRLGIKTVAIYSDADENSPHVRMADESFYVGPPTVSESYNNVDNVIHAAVSTKVNAVHPGYGFLSENQSFQDACTKHGITFIGPDYYAISSMGDKLESKKLAKAAKVNTIPGFSENIDTAEKAIEIAHQIGYPVMIKAAKGGGGKGMRRCYNDQELAEGFRLSKLEAARFFHNTEMLVEKFVAKPRHVEIQVLCDRHGNALYLNERECSIQRRNQKVIEEAPSVVLTPALRKAMGEQATMLAKAVKYVSAGTVEMLVSDETKEFYFLEMNTRLQVEHPITELTTGIDIVEQMIRIAAGHPLEIKQDDVKIKGHAMECRVYAEDPTDNFSPSIGTLESYVEPTHISKGIRVDSGVTQGSEISVYYDPMISKLCAWGPTREASRKLIIEALDKYIIDGVKHNVSLLRSILQDPDYAAGRITTEFIPAHWPNGFQGITLTPKQEKELHMVAAVVEFMNMERDFSIAQEDGVKPPQKRVYYVGKQENPKEMTVQSSLSCDMTYTVTDEEDLVMEVYADWKVGEKIFEARIRPIHDDHHFITGEGEKVEKAPWDTLVLQVFDKLPDGWVLQFMGTRFPVRVMSPLTHEMEKYIPQKEQENLSMFLMAPMPGAVISIAVKVGDVVTANQELCIIEAMKMQNLLKAKTSGRVKSINVKPNDVVKSGFKLIEFEH